MTLDQLETFVSIARTHSFSRAAVLLGLAQPTLSGRIAALESELGSQLFVRHGHTLELSETGRALLPYAERMLALRAEDTAAPRSRRSCSCRALPDGCSPCGRGRSAG